jgi:hypothetical protein
MKNLFLSIVIFILTARTAVPHGLGGDSYTADAEQEAPDRHGPPAEKSFSKPFDLRQRWWSATLATGWTSREMHYGLDETGPGGAYTTELALRIRGLRLSVWSGVGTGNDYEEWDFTIAYTLGGGTFFFTPGYNLRYQPGVIQHRHGEPSNDGHGIHVDHEHVEHQEEHHGHSGENLGHTHGTYGNELFFFLGTKAIPYITPTLLFVCDLNNTPGSYLQMRIDGAVPFLRSIFVLEPYMLLGLNLGYNTTAYYGWNHFQFGLKASWNISRFISVHGGVNYSVAMTALRKIDQGNEIWTSAGVTFSY